MAGDDRQGDEGGRAVHRVRARRAARQGHRQGQRRGRRSLPVGPRDGAGPDAELRPVPLADALQAERPAQEVRQDVRGHRQGLRQRPRANGRRTTSRSAAPTGGTSSSWPGCGSRISSTTTSAARSRCIIPYATQEGEISFCAYNTGIGWRNIIEKMHMTATLTKWYEERGRHEIFAGGKNVDLDSKEHSLVLDPEAVAAGIQTDLDEQGVAKKRAPGKARRAGGGQGRQRQRGEWRQRAGRHEWDERRQRGEWGQRQVRRRTPPTISRWRHSTASTCSRSRPRPSSRSRASRARTRRTWPASASNQPAPWNGPASRGRRRLGRARAEPSGREVGYEPAWRSRRRGRRRRDPRGARRTD